MTELAAPEFSRTVRLDEIGRGTEDRQIEATSDERDALAVRFGLASLDRLEADWSLATAGKGWSASGTIRASLSQSCVATGEPVYHNVDSPFSIQFLRESDVDLSGAEMAVEPEETDTILINGDRIDMGEAIAETLALLLDPFPRSESADEYLRSLGVLTEDQAGPFAALAKLITK